MTTLSNPHLHRHMYLMLMNHLPLMTLLVHILNSASSGHFSFNYLINLLPTGKHLLPLFCHTPNCVYYSFLVGSPLTEQKML